MPTELEVSLADLAARADTTLRGGAVLRHALLSDSVLDWGRLYLTSIEEVDRLLAVNRFSLEDEKDAAYLYQVHQQALGFLDRQLGREVTPAVAMPEDLRNLFLYTSEPPDPQTRDDACTALKVMNIVHHLNARDLQFRAPVSERDLAFMAHAAVSDAVAALRNAGAPITDFSGGTKSADSLLLKLLSKRDALAAQVYDKVRYRIVVKQRDDILPLILSLFDDFLPFNYVIPGQSLNDLVDVSLESPNKAFNAFSGPTYRQLNFIVDLPLRMDEFLGTLADNFEELGPVMFVMVEFQVVDEETAQLNETGENRHELYKSRQKQVVSERLASRGGQRQ